VAEKTVEKPFWIKKTCLLIFSGLIIYIAVLGLFNEVHSEGHVAIRVDEKRTNPSGQGLAAHKGQYQNPSHSTPKRTAVSQPQDVTCQDGGSIPRKKRMKVTLPWEEKARPFQPIIKQVATRYEVDPALINAIIMAESGYNARAVSKQGAMGLMQLMPNTARALGVEDSFDPVHNINGGVRYLKQLLRQFNHDIKLALAAYNAGSSRVRAHRGIPPIKATQSYVKRVFEYYLHCKNQEEADDV
jgi:hypothetical protein